MQTLLYRVYILYASTKETNLKDGVRSESVDKLMDKLGIVRVNGKNYNRALSAMA